jgi:diguanylate cyclase (GGDEF)-like protein
MVLLLLAVFYWSSRKYLVYTSFEPSLNKIYLALVFFVPANITLIAIMRERGVFSSAGRLRFIFLAVQMFVVFWFFRYNFTAALPLIAKNYSLPASITPEMVPQSAMIAGCITFIITAVLAVYRQAPIDAALLGALVAFFIACNRITTPNVHASFSIAGALILTLGVLRDSYNMAFKDDLTNLPSRRSLNESLNGLGYRYAIAMLDVDHFKKFNDTYGHDVGDQVLKLVASKILKVEKGGRPFRYGGEEFTILFPRKSAIEVIPELEKIRSAIADARLALRSAGRPKDSKEGKTQRGAKVSTSHVSVTISIGVAQREEDYSTPEEVLKAADKALYKAKNKGRNRVSR